MTYRNRSNRPTAQNAADRPSAVRRSRRRLRWCLMSAVIIPSTLPAAETPQVNPFVQQIAAPEQSGPSAAGSLQGWQCIPRPGKLVKTTDASASLTGTRATGPEGLGIQPSTAVPAPIPMDQLFQTQASTHSPSSAKPPASMKAARLPAVQAKGTDATPPVPPSLSESVPRSRMLPTGSVASGDEQVGTFASNASGQWTVPGSGATSGRKVVAAAKSQEGFQTQPATSPRPWLASGTSISLDRDASTALAEATADYGFGAWASAEDNAWLAIRKAAQSLDCQSSSSRDVQQLNQAIDAIREAKDFVGPYAADDPVVLRRLIRSHRTSVAAPWLDASHAVVPSCRQLADVYLNHARRMLGDLASRHLVAARSLDLLAAVTLSRNDETTLAGPVALCLRRAALQGQPQNASLALNLGRQLIDVGLYREAHWALQQSYQHEPSAESAELIARLMHQAGETDAAGQWMIAARQSLQNAGAAATGSPVPEVVHVSPAEFASLSARPPVVSGTPAMIGNQTATPNQATTMNPRVAMRPNAVVQPYAVSGNVNASANPQAAPGQLVAPGAMPPASTAPEPGPAKRMFNAIGKWW
ncbi:hypothetical protein [Crateriforma conspicua]|uniref:Tetratricopeptide repeat protein n=1 Tax=Crateriforma conspicua TaxID=2527996 RepID=A0A5C5Y317_9PLAN|nr:hypothetical protein [Crateriforma conspicua]TWT70077.1 hypothetical protein Pan14r_23750 [Crateriforma conspicua]